MLSYIKSQQQPSNKYMERQRQTGEAVKAPPTKSVLIIKKSDDENQCGQNNSITEDTIINNKIPVIKSYKTKSGDLTVVCESKDTRDKLRDLVSATNEDILTSLQEKRSAITIVGLSKEYKRKTFFRCYLSRMIT